MAEGGEFTVFTDLKKDFEVQQRKENWEKIKSSLAKHKANAVPTKKIPWKKDLGENIVFVDPTKPLPKMNHWIPIKKNIPVEDQKEFQRYDYHPSLDKDLDMKYDKEYEAHFASVNVFQEWISDSDLIDVVKFKGIQDPDVDFFEGINKAFKAGSSGEELKKRYEALMTPKVPETAEPAPQPLEVLHYAATQTRHSGKYLETLLKKKQKLFDNNEIPALDRKKCDHAAIKCDESCECFTSGNYCERDCSCLDCFNRHSGCTCSAECKTGLCACFIAHRECDPLWCKCNDKCCNKGIQLDAGKKVQRLVSKIEGAGWGLFAAEPIKKGEYICEYRGELISNSEAERRGVNYTWVGTSYLFTLTKTTSIDPKRFGSLARFINHKEKNTNCDPKCIMVLGERRIGMYASRDIKANEELFFDYGSDYVEKWRKKKKANEKKQQLRGRKQPKKTAN